MKGTLYVEHGSDVHDYIYVLLHNPRLRDVPGCLILSADLHKTTSVRYSSLYDAPGLDAHGWGRPRVSPGHARAAGPSGANNVRARGTPAPQDHGIRPSWVR